MRCVKVLAAALTLLFVVACSNREPTPAGDGLGPDRKAGGGYCDVDQDCISTEKCLWVKRNGQVVGRSCVLRCGSDTECGGTTCTATAVSCPGCNDTYRICAR